jgi:predicted glycosyl hydrolase (DUF1957 family)
MFINKLKKAATLYSEEIAIQKSIEHYKDFIKNIHKNLEKKEKEKRR